MVNPQILYCKAPTFLKVSPLVHRLPTLKINSLLILNFNGGLYGRTNDNLKVECRYNHIWIHKQFKYTYITSCISSIKTIIVLLVWSELHIHTTFGNLYAFDYYCVCFSASFIYVSDHLSFPILSIIPIVYTSNQPIPS